MATNINCSSCDDLRQNSPEFAMNGVTTTVSTSLKNNTGFNPSSGHKDCEDLDDANDCLVGNMSTEVKAYGVCDWKKFMKKFIPNVHTVLEGIICAICGLWTKVEKMECEINTLYSGYSFKIGEEKTDGSYIVAGKGVSFLTRSSSDVWSSDVAVVYISGGLMRASGGLLFSTDDWDEPKNTKCYNFDDNGDGDHYSYKRKGNSAWGDSGDTVNGNELVWEARIKKSEFPFIKSFYAGNGQLTNGGGALFDISITDGDDDEGKVWAYGQHGRCNPKTGEPEKSGYSSGHKVQPGWMYLQLRCSYIWDCVGNYTPRALFGVRFNKNKIKC